MTTSDSARYSATAREHFRHPRNVGRLEDANAIGTIDDRETENLVNVYLRVVDERVVAARFRTFGCSACVAASSITTELAKGRTLAEARLINARIILDALDGLPEGKGHCAELAARALAAALENHAALDLSGR